MCQTTRLRVLLFLWLSAIQLVFAAPDAVTSRQTDAYRKSKPRPCTHKCPLAFEMNSRSDGPAGQAFSRGSGYSLFLTSDESVLVLTHNSGKSAAIRMKMLGAKTPRVTPEDRLNGTVNSFIGNDRAKWRTRTRLFRR